jgi:hypothetical protein
MITYSGKSIWPQGHPLHDPAQIPTIEDIAVGLGRQSRFAGQTREFYTVLCHSLVCGQIARLFWPDRTNLRTHLLLHDGHEAIIADVPTTWKNNMTRDQEAHLDRLILGAYAEPLEPGDIKLLKDVDYAALAAEAQALGHAEAEKWWPRADFGGLEEEAYDLTVMSLKAGNPIRFLVPETAISALRRALDS